MRLVIASSGRNSRCRRKTRRVRRYVAPGTMERGWLMTGAYDKIVPGFRVGDFAGFAWGGGWRRQFLGGGRQVRQGESCASAGNASVGNVGRAVVGNVNRAVGSVAGSVGGAVAGGRGRRGWGGR